MVRLIDKYAAKLVAAGLADDGAPLLGMLDDEPVWNRDDPLVPRLNRVLDRLSITSLLFCRPAAPYGDIIDDLAREAVDGVIRPRDTETRTFLHDLPVAGDLSESDIAGALRRRKSLIIPGHGVVTCGTVTPEQAYIVFSSVCFAAFVKYFVDALSAAREGALDAHRHDRLVRVIGSLPPVHDKTPSDWIVGPLTSAASVYRAMVQAGRRTVSHGLVDSFFGNISYRLGDTLYISQTGSSLDELDGCIDPCPLDGSSCAAVTASSELTAHREILVRTGQRAILHGHPPFSVIMSMDCDETHCPEKGDCHRRCSRARAVAGVPIVSGEVGTGHYGLCRTVPRALENAAGAVVYGHGVFTTGAVDFRDAFQTLMSIEHRCREMTLDRLSVI